MKETPDRFLAEWRRIVAERDVAALAAVLAPDVALGAPPRRPGARLR